MPSCATCVSCPCTAAVVRQACSSMPAGSGTSTSRAEPLFLPPHLSPGLLYEWKNSMSPMDPSVMAGQNTGMPFLAAQ